MPIVSSRLTIVRKCENCNAFHRGEMECRRRPPLFGGEPNGRFPSALGEDWCSEFRPRGNAGVSDDAALMLAVSLIREAAHSIGAGQPQNKLREALLLLGVVE